MKTRAAQVEVIEPLRGFAALAVAYFHFTNGGGLLPSGWLKMSGAYGWLGVEVFFVISGFIIPFSLHQARYRFSSHLTHFLLKRIIRLDPPYLVAIGLTMVLWYVSAAMPGFRGSPPSLDLIQVVLHLGYLNAFFGYPWIIPVLWTLAIEFQFYLLIAVIFPLIAHPSARIRLGTLSAMCGCAFVIPDGAFVFHYMGLFALGMLTFSKYVGFMSARAYLLLLIPFSVVTALSLNMLTAVVGLLAALLIAFIRMPRFAPFTFLGAISYSVYLLHVPIGGRVVNLGTRFAHTTVVQIAVLIAAIVLSLVAAYVMYRFVEQPARQWSSSLRYQDPPARP
jgi:peptidoglycan/LPS O-acetylase OafA/YrhL